MVKKAKTSEGAVKKGTRLIKVGAEVTVGTLDGANFFYYTIQNHKMLIHDDKFFHNCITGIIDTPTWKLVAY